MTVEKPSSTALYLARALLRECTYLPDPAARVYFQSHITSRFREYWPRKAGDYRQYKTPSVSRQKALLKQARKGLGLLLRANAGYSSALEKVLAHTYGRTGKRRHELMRFVRAPDIPESHEDVIKLAAASVEGAWQGTFLTNRMKALVKAQKLQRASLSSRSPIKHLAPEIPPTNIWGRPMPKKRVHNLEKNWFAKLLDKVLPPLPLQEWEHLRNLAHGRVAWRRPPPRRGNLLPVLPEDGPSHPHQITPRYMRRLWAKIFVQCPVMSWDGSKSEWVVDWGTVETTTLQETGEDKSMLFQGINNDGKMEECRGISGGKGDVNTSRF
ncbi:MAG: hypothetical protein Q9187_006517 [Circinaria calcarea]